MALDSVSHAGYVCMSKIVTALMPYFPHNVSFEVTHLSSCINKSKEIFSKTVSVLEIRKKPHLAVFAQFCSASAPKIKIRVRRPQGGRTFIPERVLGPFKAPQF